MRQSLIAIVLGLLLAGCGGGRPAATSSPTATSGFVVSAAAAKALAPPIVRPVRTDFLIPPSVAAGLTGLDLWNAITDQMIDPLDDLTPEQARRRLNPAQFAVWAASAIAVEIDDGGIDELYFNAGGDYANVAVRLLREIGAPAHADVIARANRAGWPHDPVPESEEVRRNSRAYAQADYTGLDDAWDAAGAREGVLEDVVARYIRAHPRSFFIAS